MCGIAGCYHYGNPERGADRSLMARMGDCLAHRGPDDSDIFLSGPIGLVHRRLAIVDLTQTGHQPMQVPGDDCWIVYNGEFYNHEEFRPHLRSKGYSFRGSSDTETLLYLLHSEGFDALERVAGIFSFAYWDGRRRELVLARDPLGVKQLYFHDDGQRIVFASEIKALLMDPKVPRSPDLEALNQYLHFHTPIFERTFFQGVQQVQPGQYLRISQNSTRRSTYWSIRDFEPRQGSAEVQSEELREKLRVIVKQQLLSDVPVGAFFSGGIDSSTVAAYAAKAGPPPHLFGIHFAHQGVVDERPYQESAARALGLELDLATLDGSSFPDDLMKLIRFQDQPVIGAAMIPMYYVSRLAGRRVKVCLGGQAADEIFGGYARYALAQPWSVMKSWLTGRRSSKPSGSGSHTKVGGNLWKQLSDPRTLKRLGRSAGAMGNWRMRYFNNFAKVPEHYWKELLPEAGVSRLSCWEIFNEELDRQGIADSATAAMHWDMRTYLPGLFQQDDRMSMANSLESRVPLADPRLVRFAFKTGFDLKIRGGATKWILRQAVADAIPSEVLNRRKVGFDTPAEHWMKGQHASFVRDLLLSREARSRALWDSRSMERLLDHHSDPYWFDIAWKCVCIEAWARTFLDGSSGGGSWEPGNEIRIPEDRTHAGDWLQEVREMGMDQVLFRVGFEFQQRTGLAKLLHRNPPTLDEREVEVSTPALGTAIPFAPAPEVATSVGGILQDRDRGSLLELAKQAIAGKILCFGRWSADFGNPIDWHLHPVSQRRWNPDAHWSAVLREGNEIGDIKLTWEVGRFPQAYLLARAATFHPESAAEMGDAFESQVSSFLQCNPVNRGVHWVSGQEMVFRLMAWLFALRTFDSLGRSQHGVKKQIVSHLHDTALHLERNLDYARRSVYNNHLLSEALGLYVCSRLLPSSRSANRWRKTGLDLLEEQAEVQIYADGGYLQNSHNYHRVALQDLLWAWICKLNEGKKPPAAWRLAMERSLDFLVAHQNPGDGRLPNYGPNDGSHPIVLSCSDYSDFRPILQAVSSAVRGERLYGRGPWDELSAWLLGPRSLDLPLRETKRRTISFGGSGYHVLRGKQEDNFGGFRCGSLRDRFSQIDMLHLDVWWKGENVLVDGGSYLYNDAPHWHDHFHRTGSHNTVTLDGRDQMLHLRRFKSVYWTRARTLGVEDCSDWSMVTGEHYGYRRHPGRVTHRRQVLFIKDDLWVVVDTLEGDGEHVVRLQWLGGPYPYEHDGVDASLQLSTPKGNFAIGVVDDQGRPVKGTVVAGRSSPPRGWLSRYYGEKVSVPSLAVQVRRRLPLVMVSVLGGGRPQVQVEGDRWRIDHLQGKVSFRLDAGLMDQIVVQKPL